MTQEEKAKAYDEAIRKAKITLSCCDSASIITEHTVYDIFPELKESEEEQHRKWILEYLYDGLRKTDEQFKEQFKSAIAWLEKQGEKSSEKPKWCHHKVDFSECSDEYRKAYYDGWNNCNQQHEQLKAGQKPTDKTEPKFKIGDFIANDYCRGQVVEITDDAYLLDTGQGIPFSCEHNAHLWTIQDAKDGDVLITNKKQPFIFNGHYDDDTDYVYAYCGISDLVKDDSFYANEECVEEESKVWCTNENVCPATKEQRDLLFSKMKEAEYEWDAEKKELKKIESFDKFEGLTDFERTLADICIGWIGEEPGWKEYIKDNTDVLLRIAVEKFNSIQDVPFEQEPTTWSEKDENNYTNKLNITSKWVK